MRLITSLIICLSLLTFISVSQKTLKVQAFDEIRATGHVTVNVLIGKEHKVEVVFPEGMEEDKLDWKQKGSYIKFSQLDGEFKDTPVEILITLPKLKALKSSGDARITLARKSEPLSGDVELECQAGGHIFVRVEANNVDAGIGQGGSITISGTATNVELSVSTGGSIGASLLKAQNVQANVNAGGTIYTYPIKSLFARVKAGGNIYYVNEPDKIDKKTTLGGNIEKGEGLKKLD